MPRVFISMTSTAERAGTLGQTLKTLVDQSLQPDGLVIALPPGVNFVEEHDLSKYPLFEKTRIVRLSNDRGPVEKLAILEHDRSLVDDDVIVTIDDDILYHPDWLKTLVAGAHEFPDDAVGFSGWDASGFVRASTLGLKDDKSDDFVFPRAPCTCDVLEGWAGVAYRRRFFYIDPVLSFASVLSPLPMFKLVDDVWISWHLHRRGIKRRLLGGMMAQPKPDGLPGLHNRADFVKMNREAAIVAFGGIE